MSTAPTPPVSAPAAWRRWLPFVGAAALVGLFVASTDRAAVLAAVKAYDAEGITKPIKFTENGEATEASTIYMYKVEGGKITYVSDIK